MYRSNKTQQTSGTNHVCGVPCQTFEEICRAQLSRRIPQQFDRPFQEIVNEVVGKQRYEHWVAKYVMELKLKNMKEQW